MPYRESDVIIVLGAGLDETGALVPENHDRLDVGVGLFEAGVAPHLAMSGGCPANVERAYKTESEQLEDIAVLQKGVPRGSVFTEKRSRNTLGNAVFTKQQLLVPNGWDRVTVVTSDSHMERALKFFDFTLGDDFVIEGVAAPDKSGTKRKFSEAMSTAFFEYVVEGVERGDDKAIEQRLVERMPGYGSSITYPELVVSSLISFGRRHAPGNRPISPFSIFSEQS